MGYRRAGTLHVALSSCRRLCFYRWRTNHRRTQAAYRCHRPAAREGGFQGRIDELVELGSMLTGDNRPPVITIHGTGGQGKTALAREAVERFAFAWPGGIWAISLENLPSREVFLTTLARFLGIPVQEIAL